MKTSSTKISTVHRLAKRLEEDIQHRGLRVGDRYLTAHEAGEMLGVSRAMAQRALKVLADSNRVLRRQSLGTFVGPGPEPSSVPEVRTLYLLAREDDRGFIPERYGRMLHCLREETGCNKIDQGFVPRDGGAAYVRHLVGSGRKLGKIVGVVAVSCPPEVYRFLAESGVPAVVAGSLGHDMPPLVSVDVDNRQAGRVLAGYLAERGHRQMALLAPGYGRPGDHDFLDGVGDALTAAGLSPSAMIMRLVPHAKSIYLATARQLLKSADRPTALIARTDYACDAVRAAVSELDLDVPGQVEIVCQEDSMAEVGELDYPHVAPKIAIEEMARLLARMLRQQAESGQVEQDRAVIPVEFRGGVEQATHAPGRHGAKEPPSGDSASEVQVAALPCQPDSAIKKASGFLFPETPVERKEEERENPFGT